MPKVLLVMVIKCMLKCVLIIFFSYSFNMEIQVNYVNTRGRVYECLQCEPESVKRMDGTKMKSHFYKYHVPLDCNPFYCTLCGFHSETQTPLEKHVQGYKPHIRRKKELEMQGQVVRDESHLLKSEKPTVMRIGLHARQFSKEESNEYWRSRSQLGGADPYNADFASWMEEALHDNDATQTVTSAVPTSTDTLSTPLTPLPSAVSPDSLSLVPSATTAMPNPGVVTTTLKRSADTALLDESEFVPDYQDDSTTDDVPPAREAKCARIGLSSEHSTLTNSIDRLNAKIESLLAEVTLFRTTMSRHADIMADVLQHMRSQTTVPVVLPHEEPHREGRPRDERRLQSRSREERRHRR